MHILDEAQYNVGIDKLKIVYILPPESRGYDSNNRYSQSQV